MCKHKIQSRIYWSSNLHLLSRPQLQPQLGCFAPHPPAPAVLVPSMACHNYLGPPIFQFQRSLISKSLCEDLWLWIRVTEDPISGGKNLFGCQQGEGACRWLFCIVYLLRLSRATPCSATESPVVPQWLCET